jgi:hypothetical protein
MRYIDIDDLELPDGWADRAEQALNELRNEINAAEAAAIADGKDAVGIAAARKKAITEGTTKPLREKLWQELAVPLKQLFYDKCWYSESRNPMSDKNVDHFRPKNAVAEEASHGGYWWLAFDPSNYRYASQWCNQRRNDKENQISGGKWTHFPLLPGSFRARAEGDDIGQEDIELLDPVDPEDWKLLTFRPDGRPTSASAPGTREFRRAEASIRIYHLDCIELVRERKLLAGEVQRVIQEMERLRPQVTDDIQMRGYYKRQQKELLKLIRRRADYSAAALAYARAQIYKLDQGHEVKRPWLEDILSTNYE